LGEDVLLCSGEEVIFGFDPSLGDFLWQDGNTFSDYTIHEGGTYSLTVSNMCGEEWDEIEVALLDTPFIDLGLDLHLCQDDTVHINLDPALGSFLWQDGSTSSSYSISMSGLYSITLTNACGAVSDSLMVNLTTLQEVDLGPDLVACPGDQIVLHATTPGASYEWNDLSTDDTLVVTDAGTFSVRVYNACQSFRDTIEISINNSPPSISLPADFTLCQGLTDTLDVAITGVSYLWNDGSMQSQLIVQSPGVYALTVSNSCGTDSDTVVVSAGDIAPGV
jgi:hypothetical protein